VGCGFGYGSARLAERAAKVTGIDVFEDALAYAHERYGAAAAFLRADGLRMPFASGGFDVVTCFEVVEHVPEPQRLLREIRRVLASDGVAVLSTPIRSPSGEISDPTHLREYDPAEFQEELVAAGFARVELLGQHLAPGIWQVHALSAQLSRRDVFGLRRLMPPRLKAAIFSLLFRVRFGAPVRAAATTSISSDLEGAAVQVALCRG